MESENVLRKANASKYASQSNLAVVFKCCHVIRYYLGFLMIQKYFFKNGFIYNLQPRKVEKKILKLG